LAAVVVSALGVAASASRHGIDIPRVVIGRGTALSKRGEAVQTKERTIRYTNRFTSDASKGKLSSTYSCCND
jgi:hypothetical protein